MNRIGNYFSDTAYQDTSHVTEPNAVDHHIGFENKIKIKVNPFKLECANRKYNK